MAGRSDAPSFAEWRRAALPLVPGPSGGRGGDPGLYGPGSTAWRVGRERALLAGGQAALLMQVAHPLVAAGVAAHSRFQRDPFARLRNTMGAMLEVTFGDRAAAATAARRVAAVHRGVRGALAAPAGRFPEGTPFDAADHDLALWVHATLVHAALEAHAVLVRPLGGRERAAYYLETMTQARMFGVDVAAMPRTYEEFRSYLRGVVEGPTLVVDRTSSRLAEEILHPPLPPGLGGLAAVGRVLTAGMLPPRLRDSFGLPWGPAERTAFRGIAATSRALSPVLPDRLRTWPHYRAAVARAARRA